MQTFEARRAKPTVLADRRAAAAERKVVALEEAIERKRATVERLRAEVADARAERDRWRTQAERLAVSFERLKSPVATLSPAPTAQAPSPATTARPDDDLLYGVPAVAKAFGLTNSKVYHLKDKHGLPTFKIGGTVCASRRAVAAWIEQQSQGGR